MTRRKISSGLPRTPTEKALEELDDHLLDVLGKHHPDASVDELIDAGLTNDDIDGLEDFLGLLARRR